MSSEWNTAVIYAGGIPKFFSGLGLEWESEASSRKAIPVCIQIYINSQIYPHVGSELVNLWVHCCEKAVANAVRKQPPQ